MSQEIYQQVMALLEQGRHQEAYEMLLTIPDYPPARPLLDELLAGGKIQPVRPDIPTAAFIVPQKRAELKRATSEIKMGNQLFKRFFAVFLVILFGLIVAVVVLTILN